MRPRDKGGAICSPRRRRVVQRELLALALHVAEDSIMRDDTSQVSEAGIRFGICHGFCDAWLMAHQRHATHLIEATARYAAVDNLAAQFILAASKSGSREGAQEIARQFEELCASLSTEISRLISRAIEEQGWTSLLRVAEPPPNPFAPDESDS